MLSCIVMGSRFADILGYRLLRLCCLRGDCSRIYRNSEDATQGRISNTMKTPRFGAPRQGLTGAIFMIGLAILFATDWIWPGILVLVGVTSLVGAYLGRSEPDPDDIPLRVEQPLGDEQPSMVRYASQCASCGAATPENLREGTSAEPKAVCSFCGSPLAQEE